MLAGQLCLDGKGLERDQVAALHWFGLAAQGGNVMAMNMVGRCCEHGWVVDRDMEQAADHYRHAAEGGDFRGQFNHARMLAARGDRESAHFWLARMQETATPAFLAKAGNWIRENL